MTAKTAKTTKTTRTEPTICQFTICYLLHSSRFLVIRLRGSFRGWVAVQSPIQCRQVDKACPLGLAHLGFRSVASSYGYGLNLNTVLLESESGRARRTRPPPTLVRPWHFCT